MELFKKYRTKFNEFGVNTNLRKAHFMGQIEFESNLKPISENLNYSESALINIFGKYFTEETAKLYARKPEQIANIIYSNRMGNGDTESGDGWSYRGRGFIQLTGKNNYKNLSDYTGIDFVSDPDQLLNEPDAIIAALWYWQTNKINKYADLDDCEGVTRKINGGTIGLVRRMVLTDAWKLKI